MISVPVLFTPSFAVTVITLTPLDKLIAEVDQLVVPTAVPLPPLSLLHVTLIIPLPLPVALPPKLIVPVVAVYVPPDVGVVIVTTGAVVSDGDDDNVVKIYPLPLI